MSYDPSNYDPENAVEQKRTHVGRVTANHLTTVPEQYSAVVAARGVPDAWWALEVQALDAVFEDGNIPEAGTYSGAGLMWKNDAGEPYGPGSRPTILAKAFRECPRADGIPGGFTAWPGNPKSQEIIGQVFVFEGRKVEGKRVTWVNVPIAHLGGPDYQFRGEKRILVRRNSEDGVAVSPTPVAVDDGATEAKLVEILTGKQPSQVFDVILGDSFVKSVPTFKGVNLIGAAADGSLVDLLPMEVNGDGTLKPVSLNS